MRTLQVGDWVSHVNRPGEYGQIVGSTMPGWAMVKWNDKRMDVLEYRVNDLLLVIPAPALPNGDSNEDK